MNEPIDGLALDRFTGHLAAEMGPDVPTYRNKERPVDLAIGTEQLVAVDGALEQPPNIQVLGRDTLDQLVTVEGFVGLEAGTDPTPSLRQLAARVRQAVARNRQLGGIAIDTRHVHTDFDLDRTVGKSLTAAFGADFAIRLRTPFGEPFQVTA